MNLGLKNILIYCLKKLEQHLFILEPHISFNQNWEIVWHPKFLKNLSCLQ